MASVTNSAGTGANGTGGGSDSWSAPGNITASDDTYATISNPGFISKDLECTNFGFAIPAGATIDGIEVNMERYKSAGSINDSSVKLLNADGAGGETSVDRETGLAWLGIEGVVTFGGSTDNWGETWTPAKINSSSFGLRFQCQGFSIFGNDVGLVDHVEITVYYTATAASFHKIGNLDIDSIKIGGLSVNKIYIGSTEI